MYTANRIVPKLVTDTSLKRSRIDNSDGTSSIRVSNTTEPTPADLSTLEDNTGSIKTYSQAINDKVGFKTDAAWDGETTNPSVISLLKTIASNSGGSEVTITPTLQSGTKVADYTIDNTSGSLYAPNPGDVVTITPSVSTGTKIADYTINGVSGELFAPSSGGSTINLSTLKILETYDPFYVTFNHADGWAEESIFNYLLINGQQQSSFPTGTTHMLFRIDGYLYLGAVNTYSNGSIVYQVDVTNNVVSSTSTTYPGIVKLNFAFGTQPASMGQNQNYLLFSKNEQSLKENGGVLEYTQTYYNESYPQSPTIQAWAVTTDPTQIPTSGGGGGGGSLPADVVQTTSYVPMGGYIDLTSGTEYTISQILGDNSWRFPYMTGALEFTFSILSIYFTVKTAHTGALQDRNWPFSVMIDSRGEKMSSFGGVLRVSDGVLGSPTIKFFNLVQTESTYGTAELVANPLSTTVRLYRITCSNKY